MSYCRLGPNVRALSLEAGVDAVSSHRDELPALESLRPAAVHDHEDKSEPDQADGAEAGGLD